MIDKLKIKLARKWVKLISLEELRDEIFSRAVNDFYKDMTATALGLLTQEYLPGETKVPGGKVVVDDSQITEKKQ